MTKYAAVMALILIFSLGFLARSASLAAPRDNGLVPTRDAPAKFPAKTEKAAFAAGCFWGVEAEFRKEKGVLATAVGYSGGHTTDPTYPKVCNHDTGHAETVELEYDPKVVSYEKLLDLFFSLHDPTELNYQGPDYGDQYRSAIFYFSENQRQSAQAMRDRLQKSEDFKGQTIVTQIVPMKAFYKAEDYHQQYVEKGGFASCHYRRKRSS